MTKDFKLTPQILEAIKDIPVIKDNLDYILLDFKRPVGKCPQDLNFPDHVIETCFVAFICGMLNVLDPTSNFCINLKYKDSLEKMFKSPIRGEA